MDLSNLSLEELNKLYTDKKAEALKLLEGSPTSENIAAAKGLRDERIEIKTAMDALTVQAEADAADLEAIRAELDDEVDEDVVDEPTTEVVDEVVDEVEIPEVTDEQIAEVISAPVPVAAASRASRIGRKSKAPAVPAASTKPRLTIVASANVPDITQGSALDGVRGISTALTNRLSGLTAPQGDGRTEQLQKFGVAKIGFQYDEKLTIRKPGDSQSVMEFASKESRLESDQGSGSLVAAGGWCAPSETLYDLCEGETLDGIISLPEVSVGRGGINYTSGPQFADFYGATGPGFKQTEAQAIAGAAKTCVTVTCPAFQEVRLDAVGLCIKTPILTESAYPELTDRFTRGALIAFEHQINADVIGRMEALANANRTPTNGLGSTVSDSLEALELLANQKREKYRLGIEESLEVVIPFWVKDAYKSDLRRRTGQFAPVTDAQLNAYFAASKMAVQWAYDWQLLGQTALAYATTYRVLMYKAGTFVKGTSDVINVSAVYDAASLAVNVYTGMFMEKGLLVARMCWDADRITLPICNAGRTGAANFTCPTPV